MFKGNFIGSMKLNAGPTTLIHLIENLLDVLKILFTIARLETPPFGTDGEKHLGYSGTLERPSQTLSCAITRARIQHGSV